MSQVLIQQYLNQLQDLRKVAGTHRESVVREAFKDLLNGWARSCDLVFVRQSAQSLTQLETTQTTAGENNLTADALAMVGLSLCAYVSHWATRWRAGYWVLDHFLVALEFVCC